MRETSEMGNSDTAVASGSDMPTPERWIAIGAALCAPFNPADVDFRVQGKAAPNSNTQVVAYIDARTVQDRLDSVVGPGNWSFDWMPIVVDKGEVMVAKSTLTIYGVAKSDAGSASNFEQTLGAVSHCFKRAAVHWGIGRYLYGISTSWVHLDDKGRIPAEELAKLRAKLPRPAGTQAAPAAPRRPEIVREDALPAATGESESEDRHPLQLQPRRAAAAAAPAPNAAVADLSAQIVPPERQRELAAKLRTGGHATVATANAWLAQHVRGADAPKGPIGVTQLTAGESNINHAELQVALEVLGRQPAARGIVPLKAY